jgi:hypothetical protein
MKLLVWEEGHERDYPSATVEFVLDEVKKIVSDRSAAMQLFAGTDERFVSFGEADELSISAHEGRFSVMWSLKGADSYHLLGDAGAKGMVEFVQGGQAGDWPERYIVTGETVTQAIRAFFRAPREPLKDPSLKWERQAPGVSVVK